MTVLATAPQLPDFAAQRHNMIEGQIRPNKVRDERVLSVLEDLPREMFVPERLMGVAYVDENIPVDQHRFLLSPMVIARMLTEAQIKESDTVLEIAPATGYSTAALARLAKNVIAVEVNDELQKKAAATLKMLEITNVEFQSGPMQAGWQATAPYDLIFINGAVDDVPDELLTQLKDGGRLIAIVRNYGAAKVVHTGEVCLYHRSGKSITTKALFDANAGLLPGFAADETFNF